MSLQRGRRVVLWFLCGIVVFAFAFLAIARYFYLHVKPHGATPVATFPGAVPEPTSPGRFLIAAPPQAVIDFYHRRFPDAEVTYTPSPAGGTRTLIQGAGRDRLVITVRPVASGGTELQIIAGPQ